MDLVTFTCGIEYFIGPRASGVYIRQTTRAHGITIKYLTSMFIGSCLSHECLVDINGVILHGSDKVLKIKSKYRMEISWLSY